jgi:hypothetical protein
MGKKRLFRIRRRELGHGVVVVLRRLQTIYQRQNLISIQIPVGCWPVTHPTSRTV